MKWKAQRCARQVWTRPVVVRIAPAAGAWTEETARLTDHVLPAISVRQRVLKALQRIPYLIVFDRMAGARIGCAVREQGKLVNMMLQYKIMNEGNKTDTPGLID